MRARLAAFSTRQVRRYAPTNPPPASFSVLFTVLVLAAPVARANDQTPSVKDPLTSVRLQLTHYDLEPQGTLALLPQLAALTQSLRGRPEAAEAAFLRAAAANDLLFLAEFLGRDALRAGLATEFGVAPDALAPALARDLRACAQGVYREPANFALASLERKEPPAQAPVGASDLRRDASFVHAAAALAKEDTVGARFAAFIADPCSETSCPAPYSDFDVEARRAFAYLQQLSAAATRLERARGVGDPLFEALAPELDRDITTLRSVVLRLAPRVPGDRHLLTPTSLPPWPAPHVIVFAKATEITYARTPLVRMGTNGEVVRVEDPVLVPSTSDSTVPSPDKPSARPPPLPLPPPLPAFSPAFSGAGAGAGAGSESGANAQAVSSAPTNTPTTVSSAPEPALAPVFPAMNSIKYDSGDSALPTRTIDDLVTAIRGVRGEEPAFRAWLVADSGITAQLPARALVSLRKAGAKELFFAAYTKDGALVASPIRLVIATVDSTLENPDLKLRVRLGGYSLDLGRGVTDIPRVRDESGWQFDVAALHAQVRARPPRTAAVSFMTDVAVDQLLRALNEVAPSRAPIDLVIQ